METEIFPDANAVAQAAALWIAKDARTAIAARGRFSFAVSGGRTPWKMLRILAEQQLPWERIELFQVDERIAPAGDPDRNLTHLEENLIRIVDFPCQQVHAMPVAELDRTRAAQQYANMLEHVTGVPPILDLIHLGLGDDGHTASLVPGDPVLDVIDRDVAITAVYQGRQRMTLTYPVLNRARRIIWVVTGASKVRALQRLRAGDLTIPAGRVSPAAAILLADRAAVGQA